MWYSCSKRTELVYILATVGLYHFINYDHTLQYINSTFMQNNIHLW